MPKAMKDTRHKRARRQILSEFLGGDLLKTRLAAGMTQHDLADMMGTSREFLSQLETGQCSPSLLMACKLRRILSKITNNTNETSK